MQTFPRIQRGVALITILLVVVIATVLGVAMVRDQNIMIQRTRNFFNQNQARQYALGGEELSRQMLWEDFDRGENRDYLQEEWAESGLQFEFEEGEVQIQIEDLQGRLNVNSLGKVGPASQQARMRFTNLFAELGVDQVYVDRIADWIDADINVRQLGAEDFEYLALEPPYRTSGQMIVDISELRLLLDLDRDTYEALSPYVTALPDAESELNINTASAVVLQSISSRLGIETADVLVTTRDEQQGFESVTEFLQSPDVAGMGISDNGLGVQSAFFEIRVRARFRERFAYLTSIIQRDPLDGSIRVIYRNSSKKIIPITKNSYVESEEKTGV
ncbi:MAG: type II secretion system minor pseudopilin GspK [Gammaproteobacteria bacterium]|nr:type II secretion system minor pseudopilin GspK [Gammaproteobacteria bacterium]